VYFRLVFGKEDSARKHTSVLYTVLSVLRKHWGHRPCASGI